MPPRLGIRGRGTHGLEGRRAVPDLLWGPAKQVRTERTVSPEGGELCRPCSGSLAQGNP